MCDFERRELLNRTKFGQSSNEKPDEWNEVILG